MKEEKKVQLTMKQARIGANLTMQEIAEKMGIHYQTYSRMEAHPEDVTIKEAYKFAEITGLNFEDIFFGCKSN
jgi:DNA-binding XRE family transcriptional regulator